VVLSRRDAIHHVLRLGLLTPADVVERMVTAIEYVGRNHLVRVEVAGGAGWIVKQPRVLGTPDAATMWTEAAVFWLAAHEPAFAPLRRWMPRFDHYDERNALLTTELVPSSDSLLNVLLRGEPVEPASLRDVGRALGTLHGSVSRVLRDERTRRLFRTQPAWALTLGDAQAYYQPSTNAARAIVQTVLAEPGVAGAFAAARAQWRDAHLVHGDAKAANVLVLTDGTIRVIDWEIAAIGDGLWDVAGLVHSLLIPNALANVEPLEVAERRALGHVDALWDGYLSALDAPPPGGDPRVTMLRLAGVRLVQTCLESTQFVDVVQPAVAGALRMGLELMTRPEASRERWERAA
jgi:tRNA A-37 threonylcarbamoyl transferase component Bud32